MRVGLVVPGFSADDGDWCIPALRHLARGLSGQDDVRVVAIRYPYRAARYTVDGVDVIAVGGADRRGSGALGVWRRTLDVLRAEHRRRAFDVLHAFWATESGLLTAIAGRVLGVPTLVSLAGGELVALPDIGYGDQRVAWERLKVRASLRLARGVSAGSDYLLGLAAGHVPTSRLHRAPLGVDLDLFTPGSSVSATGRPLTDCKRSPWDAGSSLSDARPWRIVQAGTLTGVKDQATLLRAFGLVHRQVPQTRLEIVGDGPLRGQLEGLAGELGLGEAVCFRGGVEHDTLPGVYRGAAAFVVSSRHEAQSMVAVEAAACGVPIVGTRVGVVPELAAPTAVVPVQDPPALAAALTATCTGPAARTPSVDFVRQEFGLDPSVARFRALYARLLGA